MELQEIKFSSPVSIVQVFQNINVYGKDKRSFDLRREDSEWKEFQSQSGFIAGGGLYLPESVLEHPVFPNCGLITLEDSMQPRKDFLPNHCFRIHHPNPLHIFQIKKEEELELFLKYGYFEIGIPARNDFKICDLKLNTPVEIKINGKTDFALASGRERVFREQFYIFELLGTFNSCTLLRDPVSPSLKKVPQERKLIDLLKPLW